MVQWTVIETDGGDPVRERLSRTSAATSRDIRGTGRDRPTRPPLAGRRVSRGDQADAAHAQTQAEPLPAGDVWCSTVRRAPGHQRLAAVDQGRGAAGDPELDREVDGEQRAPLRQPPIHGLPGQVRTRQARATRALAESGRHDDQDGGQRQVPLHEDRAGGRAVRRRACPDEPELQHSTKPTESRSRNVVASLSLNGSAHLWITLDRSAYFWAWGAEKPRRNHDDACRTARPGGRCAAVRRTRHPCRRRGSDRDRGRRDQEDPRRPVRLQGADRRGDLADCDERWRTFLAQRPDAARLVAAARVLAVFDASRAWSAEHSSRVQHGQRPCRDQRPSHRPTRSSPRRRKWTLTLFTDLAASPPAGADSWAGH